MLYAVGMGIVMGSLFGGVSLWMQRGAERRLEAQGIDPGDLAPVQERSEEINGDLALVYEASRRALLNLHKLRIVKESLAAGVNVAELARRHDIHPHLLHAWRKPARTGLLSGTPADEARFAPVAIVYLKYLLLSR